MLIIIYFPSLLSKLRCYDLHSLMKVRVLHQYGCFCSWTVWAYCNVILLIAMVPIVQRLHLLWQRSWLKILLVFTGYVHYAALFGFWSIWLHASFLIAIPNQHPYESLLIVEPHPVFRSPRSYWEASFLEVQAVTEKHHKLNVNCNDNFGKQLCYLGSENHVLALDQYTLLMYVPRVI